MHLSSLGRGFRGGDVLLTARLRPVGPAPLSVQHPLSQAIRAAIFAENVAYILHHNERTAATGATFRLGINKFSDLTTQEFQTAVVSAS